MLKGLLAAGSRGCCLLEPRGAVQACLNLLHPTKLSLHPRRCGRKTSPRPRPRRRRRAAPAGARPTAAPPAASAWRWWSATWPTQTRSTCRREDVEEGRGRALEEAAGWRCCLATCSCRAGVSLTRSLHPVSCRPPPPPADSRRAARGVGGGADGGPGPGRHAAARGERRMRALASLPAAEPQQISPPVLSRLPCPPLPASSPPPPPAPTASARAGAAEERRQVPGAERQRQAVVPRHRGARVRGRPGAFR